MKPAVLVILLAAGSLAPWLQRMVRESNSSVELQRGVAAYQKHDYDAAMRSFDRARQQAPSPRASFDAGTARMAHGDMADGAALLAQSAADPTLRAAAHFNVGSGALKAKQYDRAIEELRAALRLEPSNRDAKRNLELARAQKKQQEESKSGNNKGKGDQPQPQQQGGDQKQQQKNDKPQPSQSQKQKQDEAEALLNAVQQQEKDELQRMRKAGQERRAVGW